MKPRLRMTRREWYCVDGRASGIGRTPAEAYRAWARDWAYLA